MPSTMTISMRSRRASLVAVAASAMLLAGCDFTVTNPGPLLDSDLNTPSAIPALVNGMGGDLSNAIGNYVLRAALSAGELRHSGNYAAEKQFAAGQIRPEDVNGDWARMQQARWVAENGLVRMKSVLGTAFETNANTTRAYMYAGYANRFLGENVCETVIDGGAKVANTEHFVRADSLFTRALTLARAQNNTAMTNAALAGRATVRAWLGKWDDAVADAALVPATFRHNAIFSTNTSRENLNLAYETITRREVTVWGTEWVASPDARVPYDTVRTGTTITKGQDGATNFFRQKRYLTLGDPVALARGSEMLLLRAEAALRKSDVAGAVSLINQARATSSLPAVTAADANAAWSLLKRERGAVLWLEGRRMWDLRRWLAESRDATLQGKSTCMPISQEEAGANPNLR